ncbi:MAG TPA: response regulator [Tepidisphaeraceae bacterium]|jgi:DNA-binding response OmpR family regulator
MAHILIVEDEKDAADALAGYLRRKGYQVAWAGNGRDALMAVLSNTPDLMILDLRIPELDGAGLLKVIRSYLRLKDLPVLVWTALLNGPMVTVVRNEGIPIFTKASTTFDTMNEAIQRALPAMQ